MYQIQNPILTGFNPDASICKVGNDYYIATSTFEWFPGVRLYHSKDLKNWRLIGYPLSRLTQLDMEGNPDSGGVWAPCLSYSDGQFWLLYTDTKVVDAAWRAGRNYLVTAPSIEGPWSEPISMGNGGFDPSLFHDDDGKKYLLYRPWGPRHHSNPFDKIIMQEYFAKEQKLSSERMTLFTGTELGYTEGPHLYRKDNYYYLMVAEGGTGYEHAVVVLRAESINGPYELHPEITIMTSWHKPGHPLQKTGHGCLIETNNGEWFMTYLASRPLKNPDIARLAPGGRGFCSLGRETGIARIYWEDGWPYVEGGQQAALYVKGPQGDEHPFKEDTVWRDEFDNKELNLEWQTLRVPFDDSMGSLQAREGWLRLYGNDALVSTFRQATVARRWQHKAFHAETALQFKPQHYQQAAGLICYYNTKNWSWVFMDNDDKAGRTIKVMQSDQNVASWPLHENPIKVPDDVETVWFSVDVEELVYHYNYSFDGEHWQRIPVTYQAWKLSDDYVGGKGYYTGAFVGLHCEDISGDGCYADFAYFLYKPVIV